MRARPSARVLCDAPLPRYSAHMRSRWLSLPLVLAVACDSGRSPSGGTNTPPVSSDGGTPSGSGPLAAVALGQFDRAHTAYVAGSTPLDDAGACLTRILRLSDSAAGAQLMAVLGWPTLPSREALGPDSWPARAGKRWNGTATLTAPGVTVSLPRARVDVSGSSRGVDPGRTSNVYIGDLPAPGTSAMGTIDCASGAVTVPGSTWVSLLLDGDSCTLARSVASGAGCSPMGGTYSVMPAGAQVGDMVRVRFDDVPMDCSGAGPVRVSIAVDARLSDEAQDRAGLHPLWRVERFSEVLAGARAGGTLEQAVAAVQPWVGELTTAADECARAADAGVTYTAPGALWAGQDLAVTPGDLSIVAGLAELAAAAIVIAGAHAVPLELRPLCPSVDACASDQEVVTRVNAAVGRLRDAAAFTRARPWVSAGLDHLARGLARLDASSAFARTPDSDQSLTALRTLMEEVRDSVGGRAVTLSGFMPPVRMDAARLFTSPTDPDTIAADLLVVDGLSVVVVDAFVDAYFGDALDVAWATGNYSGLAYDGFFEALSDRLYARGWMLSR